MALLHHLFLLILAFIVPKHSAQVLTALVAPLHKQTNSSKTLYTITLNFNENYLIDFDSPFTWFSCNTMYPGPVACSSEECLQARSYISPLCPPSNSSSAPRQCFPCDDCWGAPFECQDPCNRCAVPPLNPVTNSCELSQLTHKDIVIYWTNGRNPVVAINYNQLVLSCAPPSLLKGIPDNIIGLASLSWSSLSLTSEFTQAGVANKFAICLPSSTNTPGVAFFGEGPYYFLPKNLDVKSILSYTPLLKISKLRGYYIQVNEISINKNVIPISLTNSSVKLSTIAPYTILRSDVYKLFVKRFSKGVKNIPKVKAVKPFNLCLNTSTIGFNRVGLRVPRINLQMGNGSVWSIYGPNSMKKVGKDVACLGFIDGGEKAEDAIVIGTFQMENNLVYFDLEKSILGFSSTLLLERTTCGNFNFTATM